MRIVPTYAQWYDDQGLPITDQNMGFAVEQGVFDSENERQVKLSA